RRKNARYALRSTWVRPWQMLFARNSPRPADSKQPRRYPTCDSRWIPSAKMLARRQAMERRVPPPVPLLPWPSRRQQVTLSSVTTAPSSRLAWIDWMRGLACVLMFQTHCYDAWLGGAARKTSFLKGSQLLGTLPAPLFLFLAGISFA